MNKFRHEVSIEILVGLFMFTVLIALGIFTVVLSHDSIWKKSYEYEFVFTEVSGLREGDNIYLRGMSIGRVNQTSLHNNNVSVFVTLDVPLNLRNGYTIEVVNASMLGGKFLKIYEGPENAPALSQNITILGSAPVDVIEELSEAVNGLQEMINAVSEGQGTLGKLLNDDSIYNDFVEISQDVKLIVKGVEAGEGTIGKLLKDEAVYTNASVVIANLREISERLESGEGTLGKLMAKDGEVYADISTSIASVRSIAESINAGEGTLGKLVRDAKLYDETALLVEDVRAAVDDLREASPITSFGSVMFGAF